MPPFSIPGVIKMTYKNHPYADVWPSLEGADFDKLVEDINSKAVFPDADTGAIAAPGDISSTGDVTSGGKVTSTGDITSGAKVISTGDITAGANITGAGSLAAHTATPIPAGGAAGKGVLMSATPNFGVFFGSGVPTISAAQGALYMRSGEVSPGTVVAAVNGLHSIQPANSVHRVSAEPAL